MATRIVACPKCGRKDYGLGNAYLYGSPIRKCPNCGKEYYDDRYREVAIKGFDPKTTSPKNGIIGIVVMGIMSVLIWFHIKHLASAGLFSFKWQILFVFTVFAIIYLMVNVFKNIFGLYDKMNAKELKESEERLKDKEYVRKLIELRYYVPDKYKE